MVKKSNKKERINNKGDDFAEQATNNDVVPSLLYTNIFRHDKEGDSILAEKPSVATPYLPPPPPSVATSYLPPPPPSVTTPHLPPPPASATTPYLPPPPASATTPHLPPPPASATTPHLPPPPPSVATPHLPPPAVKETYGTTQAVDEKRVESKPLKTDGAAKRVANKTSALSQGQETRKKEVKVPVVKKAPASGFMSFWDLLKSRQS